MTQLEIFEPRTDYAQDLLDIKYLRAEMYAHLQEKQWPQAKLVAEDIIVAAEKVKQYCLEQEG